MRLSHTHTQLPHKAPTHWPQSVFVFRSLFILKCFFCKQTTLRRKNGNLRKKKKNTDVNGETSYKQDWTRTLGIGPVTCHQGHLWKNKNPLLSIELMKEFHLPHQGLTFIQKWRSKIRPSQSHFWFDPTALPRHKLITKL